MMNRCVVLTVPLQSFRLRFFAGGWTPLKDRRARSRIDDRLLRLADGNAGDTKSIGNGVQELRLHFGPGYRIYYVWKDDVLIILLTGGDKDSQARDIARAKAMAKDAEDGIEGLPV